MDSASSLLSMPAPTGEPFLDMVLPKIAEARAMVRRYGGDIWVQVDGGVGEATIERCAAAGADVFVAGSAVFGAEDPDRMVRTLRDMAIAASEA